GPLSSRKYAARRENAGEGLPHRRRRLPLPLLARARVDGWLRAVRALAARGRCTPRFAWRPLLQIANPRRRRHPTAAWRRAAALLHLGALPRSSQAISVSRGLLALGDGAARPVRRRDRIHRPSHRSLAIGS